MTIDELLPKLDRLRKTKDGWTARCPAHDDRTPSLSIATGEAGQILLRCFAGCALDDVLESLGLKVTDLFPGSADGRSGVRPAPEIAPVATWLREKRHLPAAEISRLFGCEAVYGSSVVFRYRDDTGRVIYDKFRALEGKRFWRRPKGAASVLYGLETLPDSSGERVIVTEGELDAHALRSAGFAPVISVPDGAGSSLTESLLAPLARFREVVVATDADPLGDALAIRLGRALGHDRCLRARLPLVASVFLAPLASILEPDFTLWMHGLTGSLKSELATLAERHFGDFSRKSLPCSWTSTDNAIEHRLAMLKDVLVVIDDYAPHGDARAEADQARKAQRVLRNVGNRAARGRMRSDLTGRPDRPPRGLPLCTGEMLPPGASILARLVQVEVDRDRLNLPAVTAMQENGGRLAHSMRGFIEWLAPQYEELQVSLPAAREEMRRELQIRSGHLRQPEAMANLYIGLDLFSQFAESAGALDATHAQQLRDEGILTFESLAARVRKHLTEIDPAERFVEVLTTLIHQGRVRLLDKTSDRYPRVEDAEVIGWSHGDRVLLLSGAAYRRVAIFFRDLGEHWNPGARDLYQALRKKEYVIPTDSERPDVQWRVGPDGQRVRGWPLAPGVLPVVTKDVTGSSPPLPGLG